ncbi:MAG TPA: hypothetical protein VIM86_11240 [Thermodesulfobacteriota bacterium]
MRVFRDLCEAEVFFSADYPPLRQLVRELSPERLRLRAAMIVPAGVQVQVRLRLPGVRRPLSLVGSVTPMPETGQCEVAFTRVSASARLAIERYAALDAAG